MEHYKIFTLIHDSTVPKFLTKTWIEVNYLSSGQYSVDKNIRFKTLMLKLDLCNYSDVYIIVKGITTVKGTETANRRNEKLTFKKKKKKCSI